MKFFTAFTALAFGSSLVLAIPVDTDIQARDVEVDLFARQPPVMFFYFTPEVYADPLHTRLLGRRIKATDREPDIAARDGISD